MQVLRCCRMGMLNAGRAHFTAVVMECNASRIVDSLTHTAKLLEMDVLIQPLQVSLGQACADV